MPNGIHQCFLISIIRRCGVSIPGTPKVNRSLTKKVCSSKKWMERRVPPKNRILRGTRASMPLLDVLCIQDTRLFIYLRALGMSQDPRYMLRRQCDTGGLESSKKDDNDDIHIHRNQACLRPLALTTMYADPIHRAVNNADLLKYPSDNSKGGFAKGWVCKSDHRMYCYDDAPMNSSLSPFRVVMGPSVQ
mmetsp:Transcript_3450/g.7731  ORF Transcript_3450/g.7731 Transcript_3450/m.7731 type:complete len:190 (+) Transcript_3450:257-826(+)